MCRARDDDGYARYLCDASLAPVARRQGQYPKEPPKIVRRMIGGRRDMRRVSSTLALPFPEICSYEFLFLLNRREYRHLPPNEGDA
jgi:hypothetical protein